MDRTTKLRISNVINALTVLIAFSVLITMLLKQPLIGQFSVSMTDIHFLLITTLWILAIVVILYVLPGLWILNTSCRIHLVPTFPYLTNNKYIFEFKDTDYGQIVVQQRKVHYGLFDSIKEKPQSFITFYDYRYIQDWEHELTKMNLFVPQVIMPSYNPFTLE